jgi:hypothetical protein
MDRHHRFQNNQIVLDLCAKAREHASGQILIIAIVSELSPPMPAQHAPSVLPLDLGDVRSGEKATS